MPGVSLEFTASSFIDKNYDKKIISRLNINNKAYTNFRNSDKGSIPLLGAEVIEYN